MVPEERKVEPERK